MPTETEQLVVSLEARIRDFEKNFQKANRTAGSNFDQIEKRAKQSADRLDASMGGVFQKIGGYGKAMAAGFLAGGAVAAVEGIRQAVDSSTKSILEMGDQAKRAGVSFKAFQQLKFVADQNRVGVDALTDGLKELSLRADEVVQTGGGSAAEAFQRLGYSAADLAEKLKQPDQLFLEIIGKLGRLDKAAQIRISDEVFGGTGGEQFVQLIAKGEAGIRAQIKAAEDLSIVMDDEMIAKAERVNQAFNVIATTIGTNVKAAIVDAVSAWTEFLDSYNDFQDQQKGTLTNRQSALGMQRLDLETERSKIANGESGNPLYWNKDGPLAKGRVHEIELELVRIAAEERQIVEEINKRVKAMPEVSEPATPLATLSVSGSAGTGKAGGSPYATARQFNGATEARDGDLLQSFFKQANADVDPKMTAWCAAMVNASLAANGLKGTGSNLARSFLNYGTATNDPRQGDIVVLKRGKDQSKGHVGFYDGEDENGNVRVFGGNQSDGVNTKSFSKDDVLGYRSIPGADRTSGPESLGNELSRRLETASTMEDRAAAYRDVLANAREFVSEQQVERQALDMTAVAAAKLRYEQQMLADAQRAGIAVSPQQRAEISQLAQGMAEAEQATKRYAMTQEQAQEVSGFFASSAADALTGLIIGTMSAEQALQGFLSTLAKAVLQAALLGEGPLAGLMGGSGKTGGGGILGSLFAGLFGAKDGGEIQAFASGGRVRGPGGPRSDSVPAWLSDGEHVINAKDAARNRSTLEAINAGRTPVLPKIAVGGSGGVSRQVNQISNSFAPAINLTVQASGNKETDVAVQERMMTELDTLMDSKMTEFVAKQQRPGNMLN